MRPLIDSLQSRLAGLQSRFELRVRGPAQRRFVFLSRPLDDSDGSRVLVDMVREFAGRYEPGSIHVVAPGSESGSDETVLASDIRLRLSEDSRRPLNLARRDFVLVNGVSVESLHEQRILRWLGERRLEHACWYIHESVAELPADALLVRSEAFRRQVAKLVDAGRLRLFVPSIRSKAEYDELLATDLVRLVYPVVRIAESLKRARSSDEYGTVHFLLSGSAADGRQGQLFAVFAFRELMRRYVDRDPGRYRDFTLTLIGIGDDYVSEQVRTIGAPVLGRRLKIVPQTTHDAALTLSSRCNVVICCPLGAGFPIYVAEGMAMGQVVLRNEAGGKDEQLREGVNGYFIDSRDLEQCAQVLELILNREKTSEDTLRAMGRASQQIGNRFEAQSYIEQLGGA